MYQVAKVSHLMSDTEIYSSSSPQVLSHISVSLERLPPLWRCSVVEIL